ncbi:MAG: hypothetical protein F7C34_04475 [Desulfurococcales archaeon]|nr:hypothetical protein [Desulfurococcales archaeon]
MVEVSLETIKKWLVEGTDEPETFVDLRWTILEERRENGELKYFIASHPRIPVRLLVMSLNTLKSVPVARLVIETGIPTVDLQAEDKLILYRWLLDANKLPMAKYYIYGEDHNIGVAVDLDLRSISREEFNDSLMTLFVAYISLKKASRVLERIASKEELVTLSQLVARYIEKGISKEEVIRYLVSNGLDEEVAREIVDTIYRLASESEEKPNRDDSGMFI